jgi:hypothetical protein
LFQVWWKKKRSSFPRNSNIFNDRIVNSQWLRLVGGSEPTFEVWKECLEARGYSVTKESEDINEQAAAVEGQWLYGEYTWLLVEKKAIDDSAAILNSDRSDTPQRRDALAVHLQRLEEYKRRLSVYEQRRAASSSVYK